MSVKSKYEQNIQTKKGHNEMLRPFLFGTFSKKLVNQCN